MKLSDKKNLLLIFWLVVAYAVFAVVSPNIMVAEAKQPTDQQSNKISLCHKTNSQKNPYIFITVAENDGANGHGGHEGDIFNVSSPNDCPKKENPPTSGLGPTDSTGPINPTATQEPSATLIPSASPIPSGTPIPTITPVPSATPIPTPQYGSTNICHATGNADHPYEFIPISDDATYLLHANHPGDIFDVSFPEDCPTELRKFLADKPLVPGSKGSHG